MLVRREPPRRRQRSAHSGARDRPRVLDVVYLRRHGLDSVAEHFGVLAGLQEKGLIRHLALSNVRMHHLPQAQAIAPVVAVQNRYGVGHGRVNDEMLNH